MDSKPFSVLVTGSSGFIGHHVVQHLASLGHRVTGYDLVPPEDQFPAGCTFLCGDIRSGPLPGEGIDAVVHLAALPGVRQSVDAAREYLSTNVEGTIRLLEHCRAHGIPRFVFASSSSVYGQTNGRPSAEQDEVMPASPYALTKVQGEQWGRLYSQLHGLRFTALRFFSVWGPGQRGDLALAAFSDALKAGTPVRLNGDGSKRRDLTHVSDVARAVGLALRHNGSSFAAFNVGTGRNHSVVEMVRAAEGFTGRTAVIEHLPANQLDPQETLANTVKSRVCLGWSAQIRFPNSPPSLAKKV